MANLYSKPSISGYNANPPSDDGAETSNNEVTWSKHKIKLADPIKTLLDTVNDRIETAIDTLEYSLLAGETGVTNYEYKWGDIRRHGAVGDDSTICTTAINNCATTCLANGWTMFIPDGIFKIDGTITAECSIAGVSPLKSVIKNYGTTTALDISGTYYYNNFSNFSIDGSGNASSGNGISLYDASPDNVSYCHFSSVYSHHNGGHGLYHRYAWGTRYNQCKFYNNGGLGAYLDTQSGDTGTANDCTFIQCDFRHNGGSISGFGSDAGGVKVGGAQVVSFIGCIIESNNGYGAYVGNVPGGPAVRLVHFKDCYFEFNGYSVATGGCIYATGPWANITIEGCWVGYGADAGNTNTCFYLDTSLDGGNFVERSNSFDSVGAGTINKYGGAHFSTSRKSLYTAPAIRVYQDSSYILAVPNATATKIIMSVEEFDTNNDYDAGINNRFTPTIAGYYDVKAIANYFPAGGTNFFISIYKNGVEDIRGAAIDATTSGAAISVSVDGIVYMNGSSDYLEIYIYQTSGSSQNYNPAAGLCRMSVCYIKHV